MGKGKGLFQYRSGNRAGKAYEEAKRLAEMAQDFTSVRIDVFPWKDIDRLKKLEALLVAVRDGVGSGELIVMERSLDKALTDLEKNNVPT